MQEEGKKEMMKKVSDLRFLIPSSVQLNHLPTE